MMGFLQLAKRMTGALSDKSDQTARTDDLSSLTAHMSQSPQPRRVVDGCESHGVSPADVEARWNRLEAIIAATPADDHSAQWSIVGMCPCCCGPARVEALLCSRCEGADLDELRKAPPCSVCGAAADRLDETGREWRCEPHARESR